MQHSKNFSFHTLWEYLFLSHLFIKRFHIRQRPHRNQRENPVQWTTLNSKLNERSIFTTRICKLFFYFLILEVMRGRSQFKFALLIQISILDYICSNYWWHWILLSHHMHFKQSVRMWWSVDISWSIVTGARSIFQVYTPPSEIKRGKLRFDYQNERWNKQIDWNVAVKHALK